MHLVEAGHGTPAVVLEAGSGCWSEHWQSVQQLVGEVTVAYSYDRAGHGLSDAGGSWSLESWLADLEAWLTALPVSPPYVLAGHSLGGHVVRAFAARHPGEVAGMVLLDARHECLLDELPGFRARLAAAAPYDAREGIRADNLVRGLPELGDLPLTVITHGLADWIPAEFGFSQAELDHCEQAWQRLQRDLTMKSARSMLRIATDSGHLIPMEAPELVASEIISLAGDIRG